MFPNDFGFKNLIDLLILNPISNIKSARVVSFILFLNLLNLLIIED